MKESYLSLGLMSGTSMDGVDASIIHSNGKDEFEIISNEYFRYDKDLHQNLSQLREKINKKEDILKFQKELSSLEKNNTISCRINK